MKVQVRTDAIARGLQALADVQRVVSSGVKDCIVENPEHAQVLAYGHALIHEVTEWMDEMGWKPWKGKQPIKVERVTDEWADVLAFLGILLYYMEQRGVSMEDLAEAYAEKTLTNIRRIGGEVPEYAGNPGYKR